MHARPQSRQGRQERGSQLIVVSRLSIRRDRDTVDQASSPRTLPFLLGDLDDLNHLVTNFGFTNNDLV